jgi:hypothetical protein
MAADLAGCGAMQLGFVSRVNPKNAKSHQLLAAQMCVFFGHFRLFFVTF